MVIDTDRTDGFEVVRTAARELTSEELEKHKGRLGRDFLVARYQTPDAFVEETITADSKHVTRRVLTPVGIMKEIMASPAGEKIEAITPTIETFAILQFRYRGTVIAKPVRLIGINPEGRANVGGFSEFLVRQKDSPNPSFALSPKALERHEWRVKQTQFQNANEVRPRQPLVPMPGAIPEPDHDIMEAGIKPQVHGVILGYAIAHFRYKDDTGKTVEEAALEEGDDVLLTTAGGQELKPVWGSFIVTDYLKTEMSEYDQSFVYVPL